MTWKESVLKYEENFFRKIDWEVHENANKNHSYTNFFSYIYEKMLKNPEILKSKFPEKAVDMHFNRDIHIHKLPHSMWIPYCAGWSLPKILKMGLKTTTIISKPAKHLDTAISHMVNFIFMAANEWTGAQAFSGVDLYAGPFIAKDKLNEHQIKQSVQRMVFELNYPTRIGFQAPFSNVTICLDTVKSFLEGEAIVNGEIVGTLGDYFEESLKFTKALIEEYIRGDGIGQPFTFPIPTIMITKNFDWNGTRWGEITDLIFEAIAKRGTFYMLNGYATNVEVIYSMCCRLTIDAGKVLTFSLEEGKEKSKKYRVHGTWAIPDATGSIGVVTINIPRIAILSKGDEEKFFDLLDERLEVARNVLLRMRRLYDRSLKAGLMPMTREYLKSLDHHFNTFGIVGLPEAAANFLGYTDLWIENDYSKIKEAVNWMKKVVAYVRKVAEQLEQLDGYLYNVEEIPAESTAYKMALSDYNLFKEQIDKGEIFMPMYDGVPFYSNSIIPYYSSMPIYKRAIFEGEVQQEFTGGVMMHIFLNESPDPDALKRLIKKIVTNTKVVYFSITPSITICKDCKWRGIGVYNTCPKCGSKNIDIWSRIVGYYRPIRTWNIGKKAEFMKRFHYGIEATTIEEALKE